MSPSLTQSIPPSNTYSTDSELDSGSKLDPVPLYTHALDLPTLYTSPQYSLLLHPLIYFTPSPRSWSQPSRSSLQPPTPPKGFTTWLTSVLASPLAHLPHSEREHLHALTSHLLSALCGRSAAAQQTRAFRLPTGELVEIHEPALTGDRLGHKTWGSAYSLACRLPELAGLLPVERPAVELGAGTGLLGIAARKLLGLREIVLTDLPEIVANLEENVCRNGEREGIKVEVLDWKECVGGVGGAGGKRKWELVMVADPIYDEEHPQLVAEAVASVMERKAEARCVVELPERRGYEKERGEFRRLMLDSGLEVEVEGKGVMRDDWEGEEGTGWWSIWKWNEKILEVSESS